MPLPDDIDDDDKNYRVRVCLRVSVNPTLGFLTGSVVGVCDDCGEAIWVDESQPIPPLPDGATIDGDLMMCIECLARRSEAADTKVQSLNQVTTDNLRNLGINADEPLT